MGGHCSGETEQAEDPAHRAVTQRSDQVGGAEGAEFRHGRARRVPAGPEIRWKQFRRGDPRTHLVQWQKPIVRNSTLLNVIESAITLS